MLCYFKERKNRSTHTSKKDAEFKATLMQHYGWTFQCWARWKRQNCGFLSCICLFKHINRDNESEVMMALSESVKLGFKYYVWPWIMHTLSLSIIYPSSAAIPRMPHLYKHCIGVADRERMYFAEVQAASLPQVLCRYKGSQHGALSSCWNQPT